MSKDNRINMPMSGAGITRYFEEFKTKVQLKPLTVVIILILMMLIILILHKVGYGLLGIASS